MSTDPDDTTYTPHRPSREDKYHAWVEELRRVVDAARDHKQADDKPRCCLCGGTSGLRRLRFKPGKWICDGEMHPSCFDREENT